MANSIRAGFLIFSLRFEVIPFPLLSLAAAATLPFLESPQGPRRYINSFCY